MPPRKSHVERKKVLLMGKSGAGKTSMRSIIFSQFMANEVNSFGKLQNERGKILRFLKTLSLGRNGSKIWCGYLGVTMEVEHANVRLLGNLTVNLWDCGGQEQFMETYFRDQTENIFGWDFQKS